MKKRAFIKYTEYGKIIPGSMIVTQGSFPSKEGRAKWYEVPMNKCCSTPEIFDLERFLSRMNSCYTQVTDLIPRIVYFSDYPNSFEGPYTNISEGCDDMYDDANFYNTNLTQLYVNAKENNVDFNLSIPYTHTQDNGVYECDYTNPPMNGFITDGTNYFGAGSTYLTNMYPGMFIIASTGINITEFSITGNLGSDGNGTDTTYIQTAHPGWTAFIKVNEDNEGSDPTVNHIIIVYGNVSGATQLYDNTGAYDDHCVQGLNSQNTAIITAVVATESANPGLTQEEALAIANKILDVYNNATCNTPPALRLTFDNIDNADALVGDASNVADWNTFFDLPSYGNPFTSVIIVGNEVLLIGGSDIIMREYLFDYDGNSSLLEFNDQIGCIIESEDLVFGGWDYSACYNLTTLILPAIIRASSFQELNSLTLFEAPLLEEFYGTNGTGLRQCSSLTTVDLPQLITASSSCFDFCTALTTINLPSCINLGPTVGNNSVFGSISGNIITLTVPAALMTCNAGSPDGDIQALQANNTVTIITT